MPVEGKDESWIGPLLSCHADRRELDLDAFVTRVVTGAATMHRGRGAARRLRPVLVAAASALTVAVAASSVSALAHWTTRDERATEVRSSPSLSQSLNPSLDPSFNPSPSVGPSSNSSSGASSVPQATATTPAIAPSAGMPNPAAGLGTRGLPTSLRWGSGAPVISPRTDATGVTGFKDPTVVYFGGRWHAFVTTVGPAGYGVGYLSFQQWSDADSAPLHPLASSPLGAGFRAAPQVFYFAPQKLWYLVFESGMPSYSTNPDITNPNGWSAPKDFYPGVPETVRRTLGGGFWVDPWVICDETDCHLFSSDNRGHLFRSQTPKASFPNGMSEPVLAAPDSGHGTTFAAPHVYHVAGTGQYLLLSQAFGNDGRGYLRSWTSTRIGGPWTSLADTPAAPFAGAANMIFPAAPWTGDIVRGELIRDGYDQNLTVNPCHLQMLYLGLDRRFQDNRTFQIGLLTQTNSTCH